MDGWNLVIAIARLELGLCATNGRLELGLETLAAMVSIIDLLKQCKLLAIEARHPH
jgi:hypothetical protein